MKPIEKGTTQPVLPLVSNRSHNTALVRRSAQRATRKMRWPMMVAMITAVGLLSCGCRARPTTSTFTSNFAPVTAENSTPISTVSRAARLESSSRSLHHVSAPEIALTNRADWANSAVANSTVTQASFQEEEEEAAQPVLESDEEESTAVPADDPGNAPVTNEDAQPQIPPGSIDVPDSPFAITTEYSLSLESVLAATVEFYPEIEATIREFEVAQGQTIQAHGNFDTKLKVSSENTPVGFYETYRSKFGIERPTFNGGSLFAGYRFGRGDIEPWYLERNTNELGELKLGANWALLRGREIDSRRVALWKADLKRQQVEPLILNQLIQTLRDAEITYWNWVAAGQMFRLNEKLLAIAENRVNGIEERIKAGDLAEITRTDNDRTILSREVKLLKAKAKLASAAIKLSLFYRDNNGKPMTPDVSLIPEQIQPQQWDAQQDPAMLVANAVQCRPEIQLIGLEMRAISLDITKARNDFLPQLNAQVAVSQDFGDPTSASAAASSSTQSLFVFFDEKDEFQVDANLSLTQSLQRRKASGKVRALNGKLQQLHIKQAFLKEKIEAEVQQNYQLTAASSEQFQVAVRSLELARKLSEVARERYEEGDVDLFEIILREKQELDSAIEQIESMFSFHLNRANLNAAIGCIEPEEIERLLR